MREAEVSMHGIPAGILVEIEAGKKYRFAYFEKYAGPAIALTMPVGEKEFVFDRFPPFFDGLLPEGLLLEGLLKLRKANTGGLHTVSIGNINEINLPQCRSPSPLAAASIIWVSNPGLTSFRFSRRLFLFWGVVCRQPSLLPRF